MSYRIYVACLASYNAGTLYGKWIDAAQDHTAIAAEVAEMLEASPAPDAEEWAIHDYELSGIRISESEDFETVAAIAQALEEHGAAFVAFYNYIGTCPADDLAEKFEEAYRGEWRSLAEYADDYLDSTGMLSEVPESLRVYIDTESMGRDWELGGDIWTSQAEGGGLHIFDALV